MTLKRKEPEPETAVAEVRWRDKDGISDLLFCTICQDVFNEPMRASCGHSFCRQCLDAWLKASRREECPTCRSRLITTATHRDLLAQAFLEREEVFCSVRTCNWMGPLGELRRHTEACSEKEGDAGLEEAKRKLFENKEFLDLKKRSQELDKLFSSF